MFAHCTRFACFITRLPPPPPALPQVWDICMGAAAGSAATLISMPFDVVKTYMQVRCRSSTLTHANARHVLLPVARGTD